jgi:hypothetical protein
MVEACLSMEDAITFHCSGFQSKFPVSAARSPIEEVTAPEPPQLHDPSASTAVRKHVVRIRPLIVAPAAAS